LGSFSDTAFARLFPIDAVDTQDGNRTFFETSFVERHVLRQLSGSEDIGSEIMFSVLAQQNWGRVSDPNSRFERPNS
jgi:hypothetical protein